VASTPKSYFEGMYSGDPDPWDFEGSPYEQRKYSLTMASLPRPRYRFAFEPGCSIGVLTSMLAGRCNRHRRLRCPHDLSSPQSTAPRCCGIEIDP
jgi:Nodulation protein S (NodS)